MGFTTKGTKILKNIHLTFVAFVFFVVQPI